MLCHGLPKSYFWLKQTALQRLFMKGLACGFRQPPADHISLKGKTGLHSDTMWYDSEYDAHHIRVISVRRVHCLSLVPPVGYVRYTKCAAKLHWVEVIIIEIWINLPPVLRCFMRWSQMEPGGGQYVCCAIASSGSCLSYIDRRLLAELQIYNRLRYALMRHSYQAFRGPLRNGQPIVIDSRFIEVCMWAYGTIYGWWPEMDLYRSLPLYQYCTLSLIVPSRACLRASLWEE